MGNHSNKRTRRGWLVPASLASAAIVASLGVGTLGVYTASILNDQNTLGTGTLTMQETGENTAGATVNCSSTDAANNSASCSTINKFGGNKLMAPGDSNTETITLTNTGTIQAKTFTLNAGNCSNDPTTKNLCAMVTVEITNGDGTSIYNGTAQDLGGQTFQLPTPVAPGAAKTVKIKTTVSENVDNSLMGGGISQPLTWTFTG
ncbi:hypothetical protein [Corynebacterium caspium]|uniref:hypothetical protein n=1 Tax=Corynebacterium caspium TaxID=234828 RepID=UPI0003671F39|nr:hypothetical protein [Corynebacterium caspium]WKD58847.1 hypothetical protein CCASP_02195 [Corynebacterium caspium DSM 44850]